MATEREEVIVRMGMDTRPLEEGARRAESFTDRFSEHFGRRLNRTMMDIAGIDLVGQIKPLLINLVDVVSKQMAETIQQRWVQNLVGGFLEAQRQILRARVKERDEAREAAEKIREANRLAHEKAITEMIKAGEEEFERTAPIAERITKANREIAELKKAIAKEDVASAKAAEDTLQLAKTEIHLRQLLRDQAAAKARADEAEFRKNENRQKGLQADLTSGKFAGDLARIVELERDAALSVWGGNRARAATDMDIARGLRQSIRSQLIADERAAASKSPTDQLIQSLLNEIAPTRDGNRLRVVVEDD